MEKTENSTPPSKSWLTRGVLGIGLASLFSDWGHEAATAILPAFLASLGAPAYALGIIEGVSDGLSSFAKLAGGWIADRPTLRKPVGIIGYLATGLSTFAYAFAHTWPAVLIIRALGWLGRGGRGPSRDALLADAVATGTEGRAFGFERAMDTIGAVLGPLCATALIGIVGMRGVLLWSLAPGLAAAVAFAALAPSSKNEEPHHARNLIASFRDLPKNFWHFLAGVFAHGIGDFAPTLLILRASQIRAPRVGAGRAAAISVGLYTFYNVMNAAASYPAGALGDRIGKRGLLAAGYLVATITFAAFILEPPTLHVLIVLFGRRSLSLECATEGILRRGIFRGIAARRSECLRGALWSAVSPAAGFLYAAIFTGLGAALIYFFTPQPSVK